VDGDMRALDKTSVNQGSSPVRVQVNRIGMLGLGSANRDEQPVQFRPTYPPIKRMELTSPRLADEVTDANWRSVPKRLACWVSRRKRKRAASESRSATTDLAQWPILIPPLSLSRERVTTRIKRRWDNELSIHC